MRRAALIVVLVAMAVVVTFVVFCGGAAWVIDVASNWPKPKPTGENSWLWLIPIGIWMAVLMRADDPSPAIRAASDDIRSELRELRRAVQDLRAEMVKHRTPQPKSEAERRGWQ